MQVYKLTGGARMNRLVVPVLLVAAVVAGCAAASADVTWSWWMDRQSEKTDLSFGIASKCADVETLELSLLYNGSPVQHGIQIAFPGINDSSKAQVLQGSIWFNRGDDSCVQLGCVNIAKKNTFNLGFINVADESKVQIGFLNFNKNGFLPVFPFINLDMSLFQ